jgi:hypothetical protein
MHLRSDERGTIQTRNEAEEKHPLDRFIVVFVLLTIAIVIWHIVQVLYAERM